MLYVTNHNIIAKKLKILFFCLRGNWQNNQTNMLNNVAPSQFSRCPMSTQSVFESSLVSVQPPPDAGVTVIQNSDIAGHASRGINATA